MKALSSANSSMIRPSESKVGVDDLSGVEEIRVVGLELESEEVLLDPGFPCLAIQAEWCFSLMKRVS